MAANNILIVVCSFVYMINAVVNASPLKLPKGFIQCKLSDPNINECIRGALQSSLPHLVKGIPSLNMIKIDPLRISALEIDQGTGPVSINLKFKELDILNIQHIQVKNIQYNKTNYNLYYELQVPKPIILDGDYDISGKILFLPIVGKGKCKIVLDILKFTGNVTSKSMIKNGETHLVIEKITWKLVPIKMKLKLDNLFNGDKALGEHMNVFLNENWHELLNELQPAIEDVFGSVFKDIGQQFLSRIPLKQIFLE